MIQEGVRIAGRLKGSEGSGRNRGGNLSMQPTSLEAYEEIKRNLPCKQDVIFTVLSTVLHALTNTEIADSLHWPINTVTPRVFELRGKGLVKEDCKRECLITGRTVIAWRVKRSEEIKEHQMEMRI